MFVVRGVWAEPHAITRGKDMGVIRLDDQLRERGGLSEFPSANH